MNHTRLMKYWSQHFSKAILYFVAWTVLFVCNGVIFKDALNADFILDDHHLLTHNQYVLNQDWSQIWSTDVFAGSSKIPAPGIRLGYFRPVTLSILAMQNNIWGVQEAFYYHLTNLILHFLITLLAAGLIFSFSKSHLLTFLFAVFFSLNPTHIETVNWVAGLHDLWGGTFFLLGLYCYFQILPGKKKWDKGAGVYLSGLSSSLFFILAILTKELFILGFILIAFGEAARNKRLTLFTWLNCFFLIGYFIFRFTYVPFGGSMAAPENFNSWQNLLTFSRLIWEFYLYRFFVVQDYIFIPLLHFNTVSLAEFINCFYLLLNLFVLTAAGYFLFKGQTKAAIKFSLILLALFILLMLPVSNFMPMAPQFEQQFVFSERFIYMPSLFLALMSAVMVAKLASVIKVPTQVLFLLASVLYPLYTWQANEQRSKVFESPLTLANFVATHGGSPSLVQNIFVEYREQWMKPIYQWLKEGTEKADREALNFSLQIAPIAEYVKDPNFLLSHAKLLMTNNQIIAAYDLFDKTYYDLSQMRVKDPQNNHSLQQQHQFTLAYSLTHLSALAALKKDLKQSEAWYNLCVQLNPENKELIEICKYRFYYLFKEAWQNNQRPLASNYLKQFAGFPEGEFLNWQEQNFLTQIRSGHNL